MKVVALGDGFIPAQAYAEAIGNLPDPDRFNVETVEWSRSKVEQHNLQQRMEANGANAVALPDGFRDALASAEVVCGHFAPFNRDAIASAPNLRLIALARMGLENVDLEEATRRRILVAGAPGRNTGAVAELEIGLMLSESRNIARADRSVRSGGWQKEFSGPLLEIADSVVGMIGVGHVGRDLSQRLRGFGSRLLAYDPYVSEEIFVELGIERAVAIERVFSESDFVVIQARHTPETERFIDARLIGMMKTGAYFINVSRSRLGDYDALYDALASGAIAGAGLDVFDEEPLPESDRWRSLENTTLTTHFGGDTLSTNRRSCEIVASAIDEFDRTGRLPWAVNAMELGWA